MYLDFLIILSKVQPLPHSLKKLILIDICSYGLVRKAHTLTSDELVLT